MKVEEELIYELVDNIIYNQDKIAELTKIIEFPTDNDVYKKEIFYRNLLKKNIRKIDIYEKEKEINEENFNNNISDFNLKLKRIEDELSKINNQLNEIEESINNEDNQKNKEFYKKSYEKIKNIILNKRNEKNLRNLNDEYNKINSSYNDLIKKLKDSESTKNKYIEMAMMLEEEKKGVDLKIIEYMSLKESYEEIAKLKLKKFIFENLKDGNTYNFKSKNENENNGANFLFNEKELNSNLNEDIPDLEVYFYEINIIDINKLSREMSNQFINLLNYYIQSLGVMQNNNNIYNDINSSTNHSNNSSIMDKSSEFQKYSLNMNLLNDEDVNNNLNQMLNQTKIFYNKSDIKSLISILASKIEKDIIKFLTSSNNLEEKENYKNDLESLFKSIQELFISFINIYYSSYIKIKSHNIFSNLILYIKYFIKSFYYQKIISDEFNFLNNQYKNSKKLIKQNKSLIEINHNKLKNKKEEYLLLKNQMEQKIKCLNDDIKNNYIDLTDKEKTYIKLNKKLNEFKNKKKEIKFQIIDLENENNFNNEKIDNQIENLKNNNIVLKKNILCCQEEIILKNKQNEMEIEKLKKEIKDNYGVIKNQIEVYKMKYGDNMELYNKFVNRINETLRLTVGSFYTEDTIPKNTQSTFYKTNEKLNLKKKFFIPDKMRTNSYDKELNFAYD